VDASGDTIQVKCRNADCIGTRAVHYTCNLTGLRLGLTGIFPSCQRFAATSLNPSVKTHYGCHMGTTYNNNIPLLSISNKLLNKTPSLCDALSMCRGQSQSWNQSQNVWLT
jgi:hypothetical protein